MSLELDLQKRSGNACELCTSLNRLAIYEVKANLNRWWRCRWEYISL